MLIAALTSLAVLVVAGFYVFTTTPSSAPHSNWMNDAWGYMGGMMGDRSTQTPAPTSTQNSAALPYFAIGVVVLIGVAIVGIGGLAYFLVLPEIRNTTKVPAPANAASTNAGQITQSSSLVTPYASVLKTLTDEERKVIEVLSSHDGKYLQKYIRKETNLSRLKTHRIVARLAERGIVSLERTGNTNTVLLSDWLKTAA